MGTVKFYLSAAEKAILKVYGLNTPAEVIDYYQRTQAPALRELYYKTIGALYQIA